MMSVDSTSSASKSTGRRLVTNKMTAPAKMMNVTAISGVILASRQLVRELGRLNLCAKFMGACCLLFVLQHFKACFRPKRMRQMTQYYRCGARRKLFAGVRFFDSDGI